MMKNKQKDLKEQLEDILNDLVVNQLWWLKLPYLGTRTGMTTEKAIKKIMALIKKV